MEGKKVIAILLAIVVIVGAIVGIGVGATKNVGKTQHTISYEEAQKTLAKLMSKVDIEEADAPMAAIDTTVSNVADELPDINISYPLVVTGKGDVDIEIFTSTEKGGQGTDGWLTEVVKDFNAQNYKVNGKTISVSLRNIDSGTAYDYITSNAYQPDGFTPSNEIWGEMVASSGVRIEKIEDKLAGNTPGILLSNATEQKIKDTYGEVSLETVVKATQDGIMTMGYTNPYASSTGLNFLISTLATYDSKNLLSDTAVEGFNAFQKNVPLVSFTTLQMREAAEGGALDGFVMEYQSYSNDKSLSSYNFTPFGWAHNSPLYSIGVLSNDKSAALDKFAEFCLNSSSQSLATKYGFNNDTKFKTNTAKVPDGATCKAAQNLWKDNKNVGQEILAVFVADTSGSMDGEPLNTLKSSLTNGINYISNDAYVGLVTYSDTVTKWRDIAKFNITEKAYFNGAVQSLKASGGTAMYSGIIVGLDMLEQALVDHPNAKPMLFVLTDGQPTEWINLSDVKETIAGLNIPVYTIGYGSGADMNTLANISSINEAASINATTDDVIYKLKNLFNAEL